MFFQKTVSFNVLGMSQKFEKLIFLLRVTVLNLCAANEKYCESCCFIFRSFQIFPFVFFVKLPLENVQKE